VIQRITILLCSVILLSFILIDKTGGDKWKTAPYQPVYLDLKIPPGWPKPTLDFFADNRITEQGFQLGRKLFYDGLLSKDGNFSCGGCHQQFAAFAHYEHDLSHGIHNRFTARNAPGLFNLAWSTSFHRDGGVNHLEVQALSPMTAANEMGESLDSILFKLRKDPAYPKLFKAAFGTTDINSQRMLKALAQFTGSIVSYQSKYDKVKAGQATFTPGEQRGYELFRQKCASCHAEPLFTDNSFRSNGLAKDSFLNDVGRMSVTGDVMDSLKFRVPSLRNVQLTFPYMHDGRYYSLAEALEHYRSGIITTQPTLDSTLRQRVIFSDQDKNNLIYFLNTLTDNTLIKDPRFGPTREMKYIH
jgi:cytochrome c peroxidase